MTWIDSPHGSPEKVSCGSKRGHFEEPGSLELRGFFPAVANGRGAEGNEHGVSLQFRRITNNRERFGAIHPRFDQDILQSGASTSYIYIYKTWGL